MRIDDDLVGASHDSDEDGHRLRLAGDETDASYRIRDVSAARELLAALAPLREWVAEHDRERAAFDRASPEERARVLGHDLEPDGEDDLLVAADLLRDRERGK